MAETLTPQQKMAVENRGGNLLVSAAAGSGKTKVLVDRLMSYLNDPINPQNIDSFLMITYTKAAAAELRGKIASKLSKAISENTGNHHLRKQMQRLYLTKISTVHSFCADILKEYAYMLDISGDFRVADENECIQLQAAALERILNDAYENPEQDEDFFSFIDSQGLGRDDRQVPQLVLDVYRKAKCHLNYEQWLDQCLENCNMSNMDDVGQTLWGRYLMNDLKEYLNMQIEALTKCAELAQASDNMEKPAALLYDTVAQLKQMYRCECWDEVYALRDISYGTLSFSKKCPDLDLVEQIKAVRDACKKGLKKKLRRFSDNSERLLSDIRSTETPTRGLISLVRKFDLEYSKLKKSRHILDFSDLEHKMLDLLWGKSRSGITAIAKEIGNRYCQIMVDEYQDSNAVQDAIFRALSAQKDNCFMVGDVKQSIYQFRLADPGIFLDKYNRFVMADDAQEGAGRKVLLSSNFRSCGAVIEAVNDVFYTNMYEPVGGLRYTESEALAEGIPHIDLPDAEVELHGICVNNDTYGEEAAFVASRIHSLLHNKQCIRDGELTRAIRPDDIVILLRSPGSVGRQFQMALEDLGVSCTYDKGTELMEAEEVQVIHSLLQVISNPLQDIPMVAVLSSRIFGFTADELADIRGKSPRTDFYTALLGDQREKTTQFLSLLDQLRLDARMYSVQQLIERILVATDADAVYQSMSDGIARMQNIRCFADLSASYCSFGQGTLEGFLDYLQIIAGEGYQVQGTESSGSVKIMSIHKSKGLEYPVVFLAGLSKSFNMDQTRDQVLCDSELGLGLSCVDSQRRVRYPTIAKHAISAKMHSEAISEELRVLYVAMTRPKDRLIMTYASSNLENELKEISSRIDISPPVLVSSEVGSAGEWVLLAAVRHSEAVCFHNIARKPDRITLLKYPWKISISEPDISDAHLEQEEENCARIPGEHIERIREGLNFSYPYVCATQTPSKLTATQLKGRYKDHEIAEDTPQKKHNQFRKPEFVRNQISGSQYGTAMHTIMQHLRFSVCEDMILLKGELERLVSEGHITEQIAQNVSLEDIYKFFKTDVGKKLSSGKKCVREFKFSILDPAERYVSGTENEFILVQGVVDCALIEDDGITIIDFKTDRVNADGLDTSVTTYRQQVSTYAYALERIYGLPVKNAYLYYFRLGKLIQVSD